MQRYGQGLINNLKGSYPQLKPLFNNINFNETELQKQALIESILENLLHKDNPPELLFSLKELIAAQGIEELYQQIKNLSGKQQERVFDNLILAQRDFNIGEAELYSAVERLLGDYKLSKDSEEKVRDISSLIYQIEDQLKAFRREQDKIYNFVCKQQRNELEEKLWLIFNKEGFVCHNDINEQAFIKELAKQISHILDVEVHKNLPLAEMLQPQFNLKNLKDHHYQAALFTLKYEFEQNNAIEAELASFYCLRNAFLRWIFGPEVEATHPKKVNNPEIVHVRHLSYHIKSLKLETYYNVRKELYSKLLETQQEARDSILDLQQEREKLLMV